MKKQLVKEAKRLQELAGIDEIKINNPGKIFLPIATKDEDDNDYYIINYDNLIKNIKTFQKDIATYFNITNKELLHKFLTCYVNFYQEVEYLGDEELYKDMTLDEFLEDMKAVYYNDSDFNFFEPNPDFDIYTKEEIFN